ncbi:MAG: hypothetical protein AAB223_12115 [Pseudomonadota bacterium]
MSENLLEHAPAPAGNASGMPATGIAPDAITASHSSGAATAATRPDFLPEKFWDGAKGEARVEALARSYAELEKKLGTGAGVPADPSGYRIESRDEAIVADPEVNALLHKAGFSQAQAQIVYDLAAERLLPMIGEIAARFEADSQTERLARHFGGDGKWREVSRQIAAWGRTSLPKSAFGALASTYEGVVAMHRMMTTGEPGLVRGETAGGVPTESELEGFMRDPRYWRDHEPSIVARVTEGFKRLYPG